MEKSSRELAAWGSGCVSTVHIAFTEQGHGYGLVQHGMIEPFMLRLFAETSHVCTCGTWTCFESRSCTEDSAHVTPDGGYASPAQMIVPLHTKFMLVFGDPISGSLQLCKAIPRSWWQSGERGAKGSHKQRARVSHAVFCARHSRDDLRQRVAPCARSFVGGSSGNTVFARVRCI